MNILRALILSEPFCWRHVACAAFAALLAAGSPVKADYVLTDGTQVALLDMFRECDVCPEMIVLPLGDFLMGGPPGESRRNFIYRDGAFIKPTPEDPYIAATEGPLHRVAIDSPIAMGRNEITHDEWMACVADGGCRGHIPEAVVLKALTPSGPVMQVRVEGRHPAIDVSYLDAVAYTQWLNAKIGAEVYRLPTEAEWEYAARADTQTPFAQGEEVTSDEANFSGTATGLMLGVKRPDLVSRGVPVPVDELDAANAWGLRHMSGNVIEQTASCWTERHTDWAISSEYLSNSLDSECRRVTRGGDYGGPMDFARVAARGSADENSRSSISGFRVVRELADR